MKRLLTTALVLTVLAVSLVSLQIGCGSRKSLSLLTARELFDKGIELYNKKKYRSAVEYFQNAVYNFPGESLIDSAQYYLAMSYFSNDEYSLAQNEFNRLVLNYPASAFFDAGLFYRAISLYEESPKNPGLDQSSLEPAIRQFQDFLIDHPESQYTEPAEKYVLAGRTRIAKKLYDNAIVYVRINALDAAETYFQRVIDDYLDTELGPKASFGLGELEYKRKKYAEAQQKLRAYVSVFPKHEWNAKAEKYLEEITQKLAQQPPDTNGTS